MTTLKKRYLEHFTPLVQEFVREVDTLNHPNIDVMPEPFLPLFGKTYEKSSLRMVLIGQDTAYWGDLRKFIAAEKSAPGSKLLEGFAEFAERPFTQWGPRRQTFWGFAMMFLAALHGREDWQAMKQGAMTEILDGFAWGNGNAIELYTSTPDDLGVPPDYWESVRRAGDRFNRFQHIVETLRPHVAVLMYKGVDFARYFEGCRPDGLLPEVISQDGRITHYRLPEAGVDVFHVPHPGSMNRIEGTNYFRDTLKSLFVAHGLTAVFPQFLTGQAEGEKAMTYLFAKAAKAGLGADKYECVAWIADELKKRDTFMSVPALCTLLNQLGCRTNYDELFTGGRGSYRLVSGTYHRMMAADQPERAHNIAVAFRRPNFEYAYSVE